MSKEELYAKDLSHAVWHKSSRSHLEGQECVEVAHLGGGAVALRDSNDRGRGVLCFTAKEWAAFRDGIRDGEFG